MLKRILFLSLLLALLIPAAQAQRKLNKPKKLKVDGYNISWSAVRNAGSYEVSWRWLDPGIRGGVQTPRISREWHFQNVGNRTDYVLVHLVNGEKYRVRVRALPRENANRQKSDWAVFPTVRLLTPTDPPPPTNTPLPPPPTNTPLPPPPTNTPLPPPPTSTPIPPTNTPVPPTSTPEPKRLAAPNLRHVSGTTFAWNRIDGANSYHLIVAGGNSRVVSGTEYTITDLTVGKTYYIQVQARGDGLNYVASGAGSNIIEFTLQPPPPPPTNTQPPPPPPPTNTPIPPTPIQEWRSWSETKTEACGALKNCTYQQDCAVICYRAVPGASCVDDPKTSRCRDWVKTSEEYHTTPTPAPKKKKKSNSNKPDPEPTRDCRPGTQWEYREDHFRPDGQQCPVRVVKYKRLVHTGCAGWSYDDWEKTDEYVDHC